MKKAQTSLPGLFAYGLNDLPQKGTQRRFSVMLR